MPELTLRFLGPPALAVDGIPVHLPRQRSLALLAYLVLTRRPHAREELAAFLSGEAVGSQERKLLRNALTTVAEGGTYKARVVRLGVANFDYTEVMSGLKEGEQVALLAAAAMQAKREEQNNRIRNMGGMPGISQPRPGGGGAGGAGGRGGAGGGQARP